MIDTIADETYLHKNGKRYHVAFSYDHDMAAPQDESDCHGVTVRMDWNPTNEDELEQHLLDYEPELEEETRLRMMRRLDNSRHWADSGLYYDVMASLEKARTEWGHTDPAAAMAAVEKDFAHLKGWYDNDWHWCTVGVAPMDEDGEPVEDDREYCGGYESTIIFPSTDEEQAWRDDCIEDRISQVEWELKKRAHPRQLELELTP